MLRIARLLASIALLSTLVGCNTIVGNVNTPSGGTPILNGPLQILRVVRRATTTGNQPNGTTAVQQRVSLTCPRGTLTVIPVLENQGFGFGSITPDDLSWLRSPGGTRTWSPTDHHLGWLESGVTLLDINAPRADGEQEVTLNAFAILRDVNGDDPWWWYATYHVMCLGQPG